MSHTPGPWEIHSSRSTGEIEKLDYLIEDGSYEINTQGTYWVAHALKVDDAHLIAAAPELLEALDAADTLISKAQQILARYLTRFEPGGLTGKEALLELLGLLEGPKQREWQEAARAAIKKAKGEA